MSIQSSINKTIGAIGIASKLFKRQEEAMKVVETKREAQKKQRRNFKDYLRKLPVYNSDKTVGSLGEKAVTEIAKKYTSSQRKKLMDDIDKGRKK